MTLLPEVETALRDGVRRDHHTATARLRPRSERISSRPSWILPALSMTVGAVAVAVLLAALLAGHGPTRQPTNPASHGMASRSLPGALLARFVVLRRPTTTDDALPKDIMNILARGQITGVDPSLARLLLSSSTASIWLVPGARTTCIFSRQPVFTESSVENIGAACSSDTRAEQRGIIYGDGNILAGVLPDGSSNATFVFRDGSTAQLPTNGQGAFAQQLDPRPTSLTYTLPDGAQYTQRLPQPRTHGA